MSVIEWPEVIVKDVCESVIDCVNKTAPVVDYETPYKMIRTTNVKNGVVNIDSVRYVEKDVFEKWTRRAVPKVGDVILTREAPLGDIGMLTKSGEKIFLGQRLMQYRTDPEKLDNYFLLYALQESYMQGQLKAASSGSTVEHIRVGDAESLKIRLPELEIQKKLSSILKAYDNLIENNNRCIAILEEMAQSLYREWFVKFRFPDHENTKFRDSKLDKIPEGWEVAELGSFIDFWNGKKAEKTEDGEYVLYGANGIIGRTQEFKYENAIIIGRVGAYCGAAEYCFDKFWGSDNTIIAKLKNNQYISYLFLLLKNLNLNTFAGGAAQPLLTQSTLKKIGVILPSTKIIEAFSNLVDKFYKQVIVLKKKNNILKLQRDLLLPKLISGSVSI